MDSNPTSDMITSTYSFRDMLNFYKNKLMMSAAANAISIQDDMNTKGTDPETPVDADGLDTSKKRNNMVPVKDRLEKRKHQMQKNVMDKLKAVDDLLALTDEELNVRFSEDFLKVDESQLSPELQAGQVCVLPDGSDGVIAEINGVKVCIDPQALTTSENVEAPTDTSAPAPIEATPDTQTIEDVPATTPEA